MKLPEIEILVDAPADAIGTGRESVAELTVTMRADGLVDASTSGRLASNLNSTGFEHDDKLMWTRSTGEFDNGVVPDDKKIEKFLETLIPHFRKLASEITVEWNDSKRCNEIKLNAEAQEAYDHIEGELRYFEFGSDQISSISADNYVGEDELSYFGLSIKSKHHEVVAAADLIILDTVGEMMIEGGAPALTEIFLNMIDQITPD